MHDHHGGAGLNLLPLWAQVTWLLVLSAVTATHVVHLLTMRGQQRAWHLTHLVMGVGMLYMFAPWSGQPLSARAWQYLFAAVAVAVVTWLGAALQQGRAVNVLWVPAAVGMAAMAYMFAQHRGSGVPALTYLLAGYYLLEAAGWAQGWFGEDGARRRSAVPFALGSGGAPAAPLAGCSRWGVDASQAAMCVAMAYMFLAMDAGAREFFGKAFAGGAVTEQTMWAGALIALAVLACVPGPARERPAAQPSRAGAGRRELADR